MVNPHFDSFASFALAVRRAVETRDPDRRLIMAAAPTTTSQESTGRDGGYLVPPDLRSEVATALLAETSLLGRTDRQLASSNSIVVPADLAPPWAGAQASPEPEGAVLAQAKLSLESRTVRLHKLQMLLPVSNELYEDAVGLTAYLRAAVPARLDFKVTDYLINGDGALKPQGLLNSTCKVTQAKEGGQAAGTILFPNVSKMFSRMHVAGKSRAVWIIHPDVETQLQTMVTPAGTAAGSPALVYPPDSPYGFMFGRPVLVSEAAQLLGTEGDIILADPMGILTATREGVAREDFSIHVWFDLDLAAFRFTMRLGAVPWLAAPVTRYRGGSTCSTVVTLESR